jgi:hypothetical protein
MCRCFDNIRRNNASANPRSASQLPLNPLIDVPSSKAPEPPDAYPANLASTCHSLQRLRMDAKDCSCLYAIQEPLWSMLTSRDEDAPLGGGNDNRPNLTSPRISDMSHRNSHDVSTSSPTVPQDVFPSPILLIYAAIAENYGGICVQGAQGTKKYPTCTRNSNRVSVSVC